MTNKPTTAAEPLEDALAYAFARAALPDRFETSRQYAERIVPLMRESGYIEAEVADRSGLRAALDWIIKAEAALSLAHDALAASAEPAGEPRMKCNWCGNWLQDGYCLTLGCGAARPPVAGPDAGLREASGLLADAVRRYFDEHEAKAVVNMQPLVERIEALVAGPDAGERWDKNEGPPFSGDRAPADPEAGDE
jgi:hypothetical protein